MRGAAGPGRDLAGALRGELDAQQAGGAVHDQVQLVGLVELEVAGEAEPVPQRARQQAGPGGRPHEREGGISSGIAVAPGPCR